MPEAVAAIAAARRTLEFDVQSAPFPLLRSRLEGSAPAPGKRYDAVVVTERHDLPWVAATEGTATHLAAFAKRAWAGNPAAEVFFYHTWLAIDLDDPRQWIHYEQRAQRLWECVASRANRDLGEPANRIRVMPGGAALASLVDRLWNGDVPGITETNISARVRLLFSDDVHLSAMGTYVIGLVHYAVLFGQAPEGAAVRASRRKRAHSSSSSRRSSWPHMCARRLRRRAATSRPVVCSRRPRCAAPVTTCPRAAGGTGPSGRIARGSASGSTAIDRRRAIPSAAAEPRTVPGTVVRLCGYRRSAHVEISADCRSGARRQRSSPPRESATQPGTEVPLDDRRRGECRATLALRT